MLVTLTLVVAFVAAALLLPHAPAGATGVVAVAGGGNHSCLLTSEGGVRCWGENEYGQLGDGTATDRAAPVAVPGLASGVRAIAVGGNHTCVLLETGGVKCWGSNRYGQMGNGLTTGLFPNPTPTDVTGLTSGVAAIVAGGVHTCAITTDGGAKCWGWDRYGQVGAGDPACDAICTLPQQVVGLTGGVAAMAAGGIHTCALLEGGGLKCWGSDEVGQVGGDTPDTCTDPLLQHQPCSFTPVDVTGMTSGVTKVAAGNGHTCAIVAGGAKCWGDNSAGQIGDGGACGLVCTVAANVSSLASGVTDIAAGREHSCGTVEGAVRCWGTNTFGQLGNGESGAAHNTPVVTCGKVGCPIACVTTPCETELNASMLVLGSDHACAITIAGALRCWGRNSSGQAGDGTFDNRNAPVDVMGAKGGTSTATPAATASATRTATRTPTSTPTRTPTSGASAGDANCDRRVNSIDAALVLQYGAGLLASLACAAGADVNGDGQVNSIDAALVLQYVAGLLDSLPPA